MTVQIKWIPGEDTETSAAEAEELTELDFGTLQIDLINNEGDEAQETFKVGNTGDSTAEECKLYFQGDAPQVDWKSLSTDDETYTDEINIPNVDPDGISDVLYALTEVPETADTGEYNTELVIEYVYS